MGYPTPRKTGNEIQILGGVLHPGCRLNSDCTYFLCYICFLYPGVSIGWNWGSVGQEWSKDV